MSGETRRLPRRKGAFRFPIEQKILLCAKVRAHKKQARRFCWPARLLWKGDAR